MAKAEQIATGCRHRTLEDDRDVMNSDEEDDPNMQPDTCENAYTAEMLDDEGKPKMGPVKLTSQEASRQRAVGRALKLAATPDPAMAVFSGSLVPLVPFSPETTLDE
jgi:hypothetical protein